MDTTKEEIEKLKPTDRVLYWAIFVIDSLYAKGQYRQTRIEYLLPPHIPRQEVWLIRLFVLSSNLVDKVMLPDPDDGEIYDTQELRLNAKGILVMMKYQSYLKYRQSFGQILFRFWYIFLKPIGNVFNIGCVSFPKIDYSKVDYFSKKLLLLSRC